PEGRNHAAPLDTIPPAGRRVEVPTHYGVGASRRRFAPARRPSGHRGGPIPELGISVIHLFRPGRNGVILEAAGRRGTRPLRTRGRPEKDGLPPIFEGDVRMGY